MPTTTHSDCGGQVTFTVRSKTLKALVIEDALKAAVPESSTFVKGSQSQTVFENLAAFLAQTAAMTFNLPDENPHPNALALKTFWEYVQAHPGEYRTIWDTFLEVVDISTHNVWLNAVSQASRSELTAPPEVQPGADEPADPLASGPETSTSRKSTPK